MKLYIEYSKDHEVKVQNVVFITIINNTLYYLVSKNPSAYSVDMNTVAAFSIFE